jgi:prepilin-type N-terminal cleavage/methylation domain-containing protein
MALVPRTDRRRGFSLLELVIVIGVVAVLATIALDRLLRYAEIAEKVQMERTVSVMKSALGLRFAHFYLTGDYARIRNFSQENPFDWLTERLPNYEGALWDPALKDLPPGSWYYDRRRHEAVYYPQRTRYLLGQASDPRIRFAVRVEFDSESGPAGPSTLNRLEISPVNPYRWDIAMQ